MPNTIQTDIKWWADETQRVLRLLEGSEFVGLPTCFVDIDTHIRGLMRGATTLVGGAPGMGKTAFVTNIVKRNVDYKNIDPEKQRILMVSAEMGEILWVQRVVSMLVGVPQGMLALGGNTPRKMWAGGKMKPLPNGTDLTKLIDAAIRDLKTWPVEVMGSGAVSTLAIEQVLYGLTRERQLDVPLVIIDHAGMLSDVGESDSSVARPDMICQRFDALAQIYNTHVIAIWPLTKAGWGSTMPSYQALRGSAMPAYQSSNVLMLHSPDMTELTQAKKTAMAERVAIQIGIQKNRFFGELEIVETPFVPQIGRYYDNTTEEWVHRYRNYMCPVETSTIDETGSVVSPLGDIETSIGDIE